MRIRYPSFEFSGFFFGVLALMGFVGSFRAYWKGRGEWDADVRRV